MASPPKSSHPTPRIVALALDDNMVFAFFVLAHSLVSTASQPFQLIVGHFSGLLAQRHQDTIREFTHELGIPLDLRELTPSPLFTERRHLTITTFSKFVISDDVRQPHLWMDVDTVARHGWDEIFDHLYAAPQSASLVVAKKLESPHTRFEGFNAGVLGWTDRARADWMPALASLPEKRFSSEQYLFNTLYAESAHPIDVKFNFLSSWHAQTSELERSAIIHYSGPIKPWHLAARHRKSWISLNPSWDFWFEAERGLLDRLRNSTVSNDVTKLRDMAVMSGRLHTGKGALAGWVMKFLAISGPLGDPLVWLLKKRASR